MYLSYFGITGIQPADGIVGTSALSSDYVPFHLFCGTITIRNIIITELIQNNIELTLDQLAGFLYAYGMKIQKRTQKI